MLILNVIEGPDKGQRFELPDNEPQLIGRSSEALPLADTTISRRHAELTPNDGRWSIHDLESANGTYVNGRRITTPTPLKTGDQVRVGSTLFVFGRVRSGQNRPAIYSTDRIDSAVDATVPSNEESVIMASPDPTEAAHLHLRILYNLVQLTGSIFDRQVLLERVMDLVFEHFKPDRGFVLLRKGETEELEPVVVRQSAGPKSRDQRRIAVSRTIVRHVLEKAEGVLSSNAMADRRFSAGESVHAFGIRSAICVPIKFRERIFGVLYIDSKIANYTFTEEQLRLMTAIGAHAGLALENVELYEHDVAQARLAAVGETVASLSHSIRNILQAIRGGAEVVELGLRKRDLNVVSNGWEVLRRNLDRIYELTMNMLAFSKHRRPEFELISMPRLIDEVVELIQPQCDRQHVALMVDCDPDVPPIPADFNGLHQALMNLLNNALDAVEERQGVITLSCAYDTEKHQVTMAVSDNGQGIDAEDQQKLFTPFYSTKGLRGTGLGLAVSKKIVDEHGGLMRVDSAVGQGTTFTLTLSSDSRTDPAATHA